MFTIIQWFQMTSGVGGVQAPTKSKTNLKTRSGCLRSFSTICWIFSSLEISQFLLSPFPVLNYPRHEVFPYTYLEVFLFSSLCLSCLILSFCTSKTASITLYLPTEDVNNIFEVTESENNLVWQGLLESF